MQKTSQSRNLIVLFITLVIIMMGFGMIIPVIPFLVEYFGASGKELGILMAIYALMQLIFSPMWGELSDRFGRRPIMMIGLFGNGLSMLFMGLADSILVLFIARALAGLLASATLPTAYAYVGDSTSEEDRGRGMGILGAAMGVGMVLGPGFSGLLAEISLSMPFYIGAGFSIIAVVFVYLMLPESLQKANRKDSTRINLRQQFSQMWHGLLGQLGFLLFLAFLTSFALTNFEGIYGLYMANRFDYGPRQVGYTLTLIGLISAAVQGGLTGPATKRWGEENVIKVSLLGSTIGFILMLLAFNTATILLTVGFFVFSNAMIRPGVASLISKQTESGQGISMGLNNSFMSLGRVVGPILAGLVFDLNISLPYLSGSLACLIGFLLSLVFLKAIKVQQGTVKSVNPS
ncbi:MAG: MFS transporter [Anaerolineales bacterium]|nr:MFS transporter [Anaerolineales bacterium]